MGNEAFRTRLREARRAAGLSLTGAARLLGCHWQSVAAWEHGRRTPPLTAALTQGEILRQIEISGALRAVAAQGAAQQVEEEDDY